jgi:hypothetical protein
MPSLDVWSWQPVVRVPRLVLWRRHLGEGGVRYSATRRRNRCPQGDGEESIAGAITCMWLREGDDEVTR